MPQASARGGRIGTLPTKNFDCLALPTGRPTTTCTRWPSISWVSSAVEITEASAITSKVRVAALDVERRESRHVAQQRREMVALDVGHMVGLGGGEQHLVDVRPEQELGEDAAVAVAEALQNGVEREPRVVEGVAAGEERAQHIDQHDLARVMAEVILVESRHRFPLIDLEPFRHQGAEGIRAGRIVALPDLKRRKPEIGHVAERSRTQETAGLQKAQAVTVAGASADKRNTGHAPASRPLRSRLHPVGAGR